MSTTRTASSARTRIITVFCMVAALSVSSHARADHLVHSIPPDYSAVVGLIRDYWLHVCFNNGGCGASGPLGKPLSDEQDIPGRGGRYSEFERGQIIWSPGQKMLVAAYSWSDGVHVQWKVTDQFHYASFLIRWERDEHFEPCGTLNLGIVKFDTQSAPENCYQQKVHGWGTEGSYVIPSTVGAGLFDITVEGCDTGGLLSGASCKQGWTDPIHVVQGSWDAVHDLPAADGSRNRIPIAEDATTAAVARRTRLVVAARQICANELRGLDERFGDVAHARFVMRSAGRIQDCGEHAIEDISRALKTAAISTKVGTTISFAEGAGLGAAQGALGGAVAGAVVGCFFGPVGCAAGAAVGLGVGVLAGGTVGGLACSREGDYDMTLTSLIPIAYKYLDQLDADARKRLIRDVLTETGGRERVRTRFSCGAFDVPETENHILMTESSRYLANQLRLQDVRDHPLEFPVSSAQYKAAVAQYDNAGNQLEQWMMEQLQGALRGDFHEYNARPYARLTLRALHNLADYDRSEKRRVGAAAEMVLDYLSVKFAVSSHDLRRSVPFRRRAENANFNAFFGNHSDEETWHFLALVGNSRAFETVNFGRADWGAPGQVVFAADSSYQIPPLILDMLTDDSQGNSMFDATHPDTRPNQEYVQAFRHEGVEIYSADREFLISGGGIWQPSKGRDSILGVPGPDTKGQAFATVLIPRGQGASRRDAVALAGNFDHEHRHNVCVTRGFACGLNPYVPSYLYRQYQRTNAPCTFTPTGLIAKEWTSRGAENGWLGCATDNEIPSSEGDGVYQRFDRGVIAWSRPQKLVMTAMYARGADGVVVEWRITDQYNYDRFVVRWDRDGVNAGQQDVDNGDQNATRTSGGWTVPVGFGGLYRIVIEGCDGHFLSSSTCHQGWSIPIYMDYPGPTACVRMKDGWTFVNGNYDCGSKTGPGYYAAVYNAPCPDKSPCGGQRFGFFEAISADDRGFKRFSDDVLRNNAGRHFSADGRNTYRTIDEREIVFTPYQPISSLQSGILGGDPDVPPSVNDWSLARGQVVAADGKGCIVIKNRYRMQALVLDLRRLAQPQTSVTPLPADGNVVCSTSVVGQR